MSPLCALFLGFLQAVTEFIPVSSSLHLSLASLILCAAPPSPFFQLSCHLGTCLALIFYFRSELFVLFFKDHKSLALITLALAPLLPMYVVFTNYFPTYLTETTSGYALVLSALAIFLSQKLRIHRRQNSPFKGVFWIGLAQSISYFPGISRSAATISTAQVLGWSQKDAVRFSFLLSIPSILGASIIQSVKLYMDGNIVPVGNCITGFIVAFTIGLISVQKLLPYLERHSLLPFAVYCLFLGTVLINFVIK